MQGVELFFELARGVFLVAAALRPVTLALVALWVLAVATAPGGRRALALGCPALAFPIAILACGAVFAAPPTGEVDEIRSYAGQTLEVFLLLAQLPLAGVAIGRAAEGQPVVVAFWVCGGYLSLLSAFVSGMAVTGVWL